MRCRELIEKLEELAPLSYACEWDNPGFLAGRSDKEIKKIQIALDATDEVVERAIGMGADLLLTHHPLIFKALKRVNDEDFVSRRILKLIQADICYVAMHTNFDIAPGCMADLAAERLGLKAEGPLEVTGEKDGIPVGIGRIGTLAQAVTVEKLAGLVKECFGLPFVTVYGTEQVTEPVMRVAVSPGAGGSMISHGIKNRAQVLVTGDIGHHSGIDAAACGMAVIDAGHYGLEHIFMPFMKGYVEQVTEGTAEIFVEETAFPARVI
ncbi:MAG: Nif3-like dinuclear metal center hexameric protein [Lachnospiraceae bacterium]|jgi:dinuclear metal center YbgI/SA1388 family protein|nr:Nif3-like dinuclear metal center hexameric protein [Lachnospiraceae bacterium]